MQDYKDTLNLPATNFPMKANLATTELKILNLWNELDLYNTLQETHRKDPLFVFQDGPPYANGAIHLGHAFNRILKDFTVKTKSLSGYKVPFIPGWDCHGLPIEIKVEKQLNKSGHQIDPILFITKCREYAETQINIQKEQFIRLGVVAKWQDPYITMDYKFEATVIRTLATIMANGHLVRGDRPVHWCVNCGSALAEAEVEYKDKQSPSIYVEFTCLDNKKLFNILNLENNNLLDKKISIIIWTTTPWTLPANQAVAVNPLFNYCLLYIKDNNKYLIIAEKLLTSVVAALNIENYEILATVIGSKLEYLLLQHPLYNDKQVPVILGTHVTLDVGTGCVHTAPAHGHDDYIIGKKYNLPIENYINQRGVFLEHAKIVANLHVSKSNPAVLEALQQNNNLLASSEMIHSYPHCWRHKTPLIFMATPQWFISMENKNLRAKALKAVNDIEWFPSWGQNRMEAMLVEGRPDWCISRQRIWGVPIPFFIHKESGQLHPKQLELLEEVAQLVEQGGIEAWHRLDSAQLLGEDAKNYHKSKDILDVWFESGTVGSCITSTHPEIGNYADLYLEGSDQHRGWFQSSLLVSMAANNRPPFKQVLTHGFTLDASGHKMSKSLGNTIDPQQIINKYGADLLRLWVATTDYSGDLKISEEILKRTADSYRRIRNTARFLLSNLHDFSYNNNKIDIKDLLLLDKWMLEKTDKLQQEILEYYQNYKYYLAYQKIHNFCVEDLGSFYLDIIKDRQYTCKKESVARRSAQTVLYLILESLVRWIAPILSFTAEEIWQCMPEREVKSVLLTTWYQYDFEILSENYNKFWETILTIRKEVNKQIELARENNQLGSSLEAEVKIYCNPEIYNILHAMPDMVQELKFIFISSDVKVILDETNKGNNNFLIEINSSNKPKCIRCWHRVDGVDPETQLCNRCSVNLTTVVGESRVYA